MRVTLWVLVGVVWSADTRPGLLWRRDASRARVPFDGVFCSSCWRVRGARRPNSANTENQAAVGSVICRSPRDVTAKRGGWRCQVGVRVCSCSGDGVSFDSPISPLPFSGAGPVQPFPSCSHFTPAAARAAPAAAPAAAAGCTAERRACQGGGGLGGGEEKGTKTDVSSNARGRWRGGEERAGKSRCSRFLIRGVFPVCSCGTCCVSSPHDWPYT